MVNAELIYIQCWTYKCPMLL